MREQRAHIMKTVRMVALSAALSVGYIRSTIGGHSWPVKLARF